MEELSWLGIVRHGQSTGNVARDAAEAAGLELIDIAERDADVPLSPLGREQAAGVGRWLAALPPGERPDLVVASTYRRAAQTAQIALAKLAGAAKPRLDERLRDRELGVLDLLTSHGVAARVPAEAARRRRLGKFYYRPPGGESWADIALRLRSLLTDLRTSCPGGRVLLFGHEATVLLLRYLVEELTEAELMAVARGTSLRNGSLTAWAAGTGGRLRLTDFNQVDHLQAQGTPATEEERVRVEPV